MQSLNYLWLFSLIEQGVSGILNSLKSKRSESGLSSDQITFLQAAEYAYEVSIMIILWVNIPVPNLARLEFCSGLLQNFVHIHCIWDFLSHGSSIVYNRYTTVHSAQGFMSWTPIYIIIQSAVSVALKSSVLVDFSWPVDFTRNLHNCNEVMLTLHHTWKWQNCNQGRLYTFKTMHNWDSCSMVM